MKDRRAKRPWARWLMLAVAILELWLIWSDIQNYQQIAAADIFSPEGFAAWAAERRFEWLIDGTLAATFLFGFITWKVPQNTRKMHLATGILTGLLGLVWQTSIWALPFRLLDGRNKFLWCIMVVVLLGSMGYEFWHYHKLRKSTLDIV